MTLAPGHLSTGGDTPGLLPGQVPGSSESRRPGCPSVAGRLGTLWTAQGQFTGW
jgi:hypothetical protein